MELQHFSDDHNLIFSAVTTGSFTCNGCGERIEGSRYSCRKGDFDLHPSCAELPPTLQHPLHSKHPLILHKTPPYDGRTCACSFCSLPCKWFIYHCPLCKFDLHIKCVSQPLNFEVVVHEHQLILFKRLMLFICDFCGIEGKGLPYLCGECGFWVHQKCASLPCMVKHLRHRHPLNFTYSIKEDHSEHRVCQLCVKKVDTNYRVYYCSSCDYVAHLDCATDKYGIDENFMRESKGKKPTELTNIQDLEIDEFTDEVSYSVQKAKVGEGKIKIPIEIKHFCHEHELKLMDELEDNKMCDGCIRPIFPPFYSCTECNFFLHKSCVELLRKKRHPLHQHPLTLKLNRPIFWWDRCHVCQYQSNGFIYKCHECYFVLDVSCSLISELDTLTHVGHEHPLIFSSTTNDENCSACNFEGRIFRCTKCEFTLDFGCATLPHTVNYKQHEHPFILNYTAEDDSGEYYCDICEKERDCPKHWFYYCKECSYSAHFKCIFGKPFYYSGDYRNIKFGSTYISSVHQHPLTLVQETQDGFHHCKKCGQPCEDIAYACATCNISFHAWCVGEM